MRDMTSTFRSGAARQRISMRFRSTACSARWCALSRGPRSTRLQASRIVCVCVRAGEGPEICLPAGRRVMCVCMFVFACARTCVVMFMRASVFMSMRASRWEAGVGTADWCAGAR